jgi:putative Holliday junction resolvase
MIFDDIATFYAALPATGALIGLDLGTKTIGVAVSDPLRSIATPLETIRRSKFTIDAEVLEKIAAHRSVTGLVIGLPRNMDGGEGPRCQSTRAFARNFSARWPKPIAFWDERLSTVAVERTLLDADASRKRRAEVVDKMAAGYILQGALDRMTVLERANRTPTDDG